jgi:hypothetical protein
MKKAGNPLITQVLGYQKVTYPDGTPVTIGVKNYKGQIENKYVYKLINLYGEGAFGSEYYTDFKPSVVDNNTVRIKNEIPNNDIIAALSQDIKVDDVMQQSPAPTTDIKVEKKEAPAPVKQAEPRYKDAEKRVRIEYPENIEVTETRDVFDTNKLIEIQEMFDNIDDGTLADQRKFDDEYEAYLKEYGMTDTQYKYAIQNQAVLRDLLYVGDELLDNNEKPMGLTTFSDIINELLKRNETLVDTAQLSLFDVNNENLEGADDSAPCKR